MAKYAPKLLVIDNNRTATGCGFGQRQPRLLQRNWRGSLRTCDPSTVHLRALFALSRRALSAAARGAGEEKRARVAALLEDAHPLPSTITLSIYLWLQKRRRRKLLFQSDGIRLPNGGGESRLLRIVAQRIRAKLRLKTLLAANPGLKLPTPDCGALPKTIPPHNKHSILNYSQPFTPFSFRTRSFSQ